ncbi:hypothetical protein Droror1_Dr00021727 [Drosera rotundifolia]
MTILGLTSLILNHSASALTICSHHSIPRTTVDDHIQTHNRFDSDLTRNASRIGDVGICELVVFVVGKPKFLLCRHFINLLHQSITSPPIPTTLLRRHIEPIIATTIAAAV